MEKGLVHQLTYAEIEKLNASKPFSGYRNFTSIPLLSEVLHKIKNADARLLIEIKDLSLYPGLTSQVVQLVRETKTEEKIIFFSFNKIPVVEIKKQLPDVHTGLFSISLENTDDSLNVQYVAPRWISLLYFPFSVKKIQKKGYKIFVWTVNSPFIMRYLISKNVDGIITDRPDRLINLGK